MVWYGMVWYGMVWDGMGWDGMGWYGMVWYGMVWRHCLPRFLAVWMTCITYHAKLNVLTDIPVYRLQHVLRGLLLSFISVCAHVHLRAPFNKLILVIPFSALPHLPTLFLPAPPTPPQRK